MTDIEKAVIDETEHYEAMQETGRWGRRGAGAILYCPKTDAYLLAFRSPDVLEPDTWGIWGGAVPSGTTDEDSVMIEIIEETQYAGPVELLSLCEFHDEETGFKYQNFLGVVEDEFDPVLNWESSDAGWFKAGDWPDPLHFGLKYLLEQYPEPATVYQQSLAMLKL